MWVYGQKAQQCDVKKKKNTKKTRKGRKNERERKKEPGISP